MTKTLFLIIVPLIISAFVLLFTGLIGPQWLKKRMRRFNRWRFKDTALLWPVDPYKPLFQSLRQGLTHFWPTEPRIKEVRKITLWQVAFLTIVILAALVIALSHR